MVDETVLDDEREEELNNPDNEPSAPESSAPMVADTTESEQATELAVMEAIDVKYRDRLFAQKVDFMRSVKINRESLIEVKETFQGQWDYHFKRSKDNVREANKYKDNLKKMDMALRIHSHDPFLQTWMHDRDELIDHLTTANASSLQLMTLCAYLVPKLLDELGRVYSIGTKNYLNQETRERMDQKFVELLAMGQELGYNLPEKAKEAIVENNRLKEKLRTLAMTRAEARRQTIGKALFDIILARSNLKEKKYPTASECYRLVPYARADVIEAKDWLIRTSRLKEEGKGRGVAKQLVLLTNQFVLVKSGSGGVDKYSNSRENTSPGGPRGAENKENEKYQSKKGAQVFPIATEGMMDNEENQDEDRQSDGEPRD